LVIACSRVAFARWRLMVIRHLTAAFNFKSRSFTSSIGSEDLSSRDSSIYDNDLPSTLRSPMVFFGFARSKEPLRTWNGDTMYFRFHPETNLSRFFSEDASRVILSLSVCNFLSLSNPKRDLWWVESSRVGTSSWTVTEDVVLEETSVLVLDVASEISSANNCLLREIFKGSLGRYLDSFKSECRALNLLGSFSRQIEDFAR